MGDQSAGSQIQGENSRLGLVAGEFGGHMTKGREAPGFMATRALVWAAEETSDIGGQLEILLPEQLSSLENIL